MNSKVIVTADATTNRVVNVSENPEFGWVEVKMKCLAQPQEYFIGDGDHAELMMRLTKISDSF